MNLLRSCAVAVCLIFGLTCFQVSFAGEAEDRVEQRIGGLFKSNPQEKAVTLSNGFRVALPVHYHQIESLIISGSVHWEKTRTLLAPFGLYPVPLTPDTGFAAIYMVEHPKNSIGKYREFVLAVAATPSPDYGIPSGMNSIRFAGDFYRSFYPTESDRRSRDSRDFVMFVPFITVSTEEALLAGREIWNLPKQMAEFQFSLAEGEQKVARMNGANCGIEMVQGLEREPKALPLYMDFNLLGVWNGDTSFVVKAPMLAHGITYSSKFGEAGDRLWVDEKSECGNWLKFAEFRPKLWQYVPRSGAVLFAP